MITIFSRIFTASLLMLVLMHAGMAQTIQGPSPVGNNTTQTYSFSDGALITGPVWTITKGTLNTTWSSGTTYYATVTWTSTGAGSVKLSSPTDGTLGNRTITINTCSAVTAPTLTGGSRCNPGTVTLASSSPGAGYDIRWFNSSNNLILGTGTSFTTPSLSVTTAYKAAAYNTTTGCESSRVSVTAAINTTPTAAASNQTLCSGVGAGIIITNNVASTTNTWTAAATNVSGASNTSGVSTGTGPFTYTLNQTLNATTNTNGTVTYTITPSANGCTGTAIIVTATVKPTPTASAASQGLFAGSATNITITNPNNVSGTTYTWTVVQSNVTGASNGSGSSIAQTLTASAASGTATYTITPAANGCAGTPVSATATVYAIPTVTSSNGSVVIMGANVSLDAGAGYATYTWKNNAGVTKATTQVFNTNIADKYTVTVTKAGVTGSAVSPPFSVVNQFSGQNLNYIISNTMMFATSDTSRINFVPVDSVNQAVQYFDGLGRPMQTVVTQGSPSKNDIVSPHVYDAFGRETKKYLPFTAQINGLYKAGVIDTSGNFAGAALNYYNNATDKVVDDTRPFTETVFEPSPLNRPVQDFGPGQNWKDNNKYVSHQYPVNNSSIEQISAWAIDPFSGLPVPAPSTSSVSAGYYLSGQLTIKSTKDEAGHEVREYTDKLGHVILKKVQAVDSASISDPSQWTHTYYIYDDLGRLAMVLPPEAVNLINK